MKTFKISSEARTEIRNIVGADNCSDQPENLLLYAYDAMNRRFLPDMVAHASSAEEISGIIRLANREGFAVIPRGAGTGFTGGSLPVNGGLVLTTTRMNRIIEIDPDNMTAWVEAGVINGDLQDAAAAYGLFFPPDPSSLRFSTLGGNAAENAGGPRAVKYGVTRDYIMALELVLPTGEIVSTGSAAIKSVTGYDMTRLMVGSEGTLGIITRLLLKLLPKPQSVRTLLAAFPDITRASRAVADIMKSRILPSTLEFMDRAAVDCVRDQIPRELMSDAAALLLIEVDGDAELVQRQAEKLKELCAGSGALRVMAAQTEQERERLWKVRRSLSPAVMKIRPRKINEDVAVPRMRIPDLIDGVDEIARRLGVTIVNFGHAGDGNVHVNILVDPDDPGEMERAHRAVEALFELTISLGGTLTGEHGIGIAKAPYMEMETDRALMDAMRRIKRALDPRNVLNPFKTFDFEPSMEGREVKGSSK